MARPIVNNLIALETGYNSGTTYMPAVRLNFDVQDTSLDYVDVDSFQYVKASDRASYTPSDTTYADTWVITGAYQSTLYPKLVRQGSTDTYDVYIYSDDGYTLLLASGAGNVSTTITLTEQNSSGITGSVAKNATHIASYEMSLTDSTSWSNATILTGTKAWTGIQTNAGAPGRSTTLYWDAVTDVATATNDSYLVRFAVKDSTLTSHTKGGSFTLVIQVPTVGLAFSEYTNVRAFVFELTLGGTSVTLYRSAESLASLTTTAWTAITGTSPKYGTHTFLSATQELKTVYVEVADVYYNRSTVANDTVTYHTAAPTNTYLKLTGTAGNEYYTGVIVRADGSFTFSDEIDVVMYAEDLTGLQMYIDGNIRDAANVRTWITYATTATVRLSGNLVGTDTSNTVTVTFRDEALNTVSVSKTIRFNTRVYKTTQRNLRTPSTSYDHQIMEVSNAGNTTVISHTEGASTDYIRKWDDIFYPTTHSYPVNADGTINSAASIALAESSNASYDAVDLNDGAIVYDAEGRVTTVDWVKDGTKDYNNMESSYDGGMRYWIIDNYGYGDLSLEFEFFDLNSNVYGPPYNQMAPYRGDCLVIYDASATGCVEETVGRYGKTTYTLLDSSKLVELQAYTGSGTNVFSLSTGRTASANPNGAFTASKINTTTRICVVLYTDASTTSSGFKLRAGPQHEVTWYNYDVDNVNGQIWVHNYPLGSAPTNELRVLYDYYDQKFEIDYDQGLVTFEVQPSGEVTADYTYYGYTNVQAPSGCRLFATSCDDFVDYADASLYVIPSGIVPSKSDTYIHGYPIPISPSGKVSQNFTVDKDRGIIEFADGTTAYGNELGYIPPGRLMMDYSYHTFTRLTNDGFGNFTFRDEILVADETPQYPDYTFGDVKIVNEGDAILEDGRIKFVIRGYDNDGDGTIDQVLDVNRPWDIQAGTAQETYSKTAMEVRSQYTWDATCTKSQAQAILSSWTNAYFGFDVYPQQTFYGRIAWVLGGTGGNNYPTTTTGKKTFSAELEGRYYNITV